LYNKTNYFTALFNSVFRAALYRRADEALRECLDCNAQTVLDVGCGSGVNAVLFAKNGVPRVTGVDFADGMLEIARSSVPADLTGAIDYVKADFMEWRPPATYDCVVALGVFDYLTDPSAFLNKMLACSSKKALFSAPGKDLFRMNIRKFRYALKKCPVFFYSRRELQDLCTKEGYSTSIKPVGSSGFLCVMTKSEKK
jgi:SAM-dependent methyltransferase